MTIAAAIKRDGQIVIGADTLITDGTYRNHISKLVKVGDCVMAAAGSAVLLHILAEKVLDPVFIALFPPTNPVEVRKIAKEVFKDLKEEIKKKDDEDEERTSTDQLLICTPEKMFTTDNLLMVIEEKIFATIGSGSDMTMAIIHSRLDETNDELEEILKYAFDVTCAYHVDCEGPYEFIEVKGNEIKRKVVGKAKPRRSVRTSKARKR